MADQLYLHNVIQDGAVPTPSTTLANVFSILEIEDAVQIDDKTRMDAQKTFTAKGGTAITTMTIKPGLEAATVSIFSATVANRFQDWVYGSFTMDIDSTNNKIYFKIGSTEYTATVSGGNKSKAQLIIDIQTALNAAGAGSIFTVSINSNDRIKILATTNFELQNTKLPNNLLPLIGFTKEVNGASNSFEHYPLEFMTKKITLTISDGTNSLVKDYYQRLYSIYGDCLFSDDKDLTAKEPDILKWVVAGRSSFLNIHREAQRQILDWLDQNGFRDDNGEKLTKWNLFDKQEVKLWSTYLCLSLIFEGNSNATDDVFDKKAKKYYALMINSRKRAILDLDANDDGIKDSGGDLHTWSGSVVIR